MHFPQLVEDARDFHRWWSVRLMALGALVQSFLSAFPDAALQAWAMLPDDLKAVLPQGIVKALPIIIFVAAMVARVIQQRKPEPKP